MLLIECGIWIKLFFVLPWVLESRHVDDCDGGVGIIGGCDRPVDQIDDGVKCLLIKACHVPFQ